MRTQLSRHFRHLCAWCLALGALVGCAVAAPVQEMSNARQAIQAAREAKAEQYAPAVLDTAERLLKQATDELERGNYDSARQNALAARDEAVRARRADNRDLHEIY